MKQEIKNQYQGLDPDPKLLSELTEIIKANGHPVYLEEFLDKKEEEKQS